MTRRLRLILVFIAAIFCGPVQASTGASILIENQRSDRVEVWIDRQSVGDVRGDTIRVFRVTTGRHDVEIRDRNGMTIRQAGLTSTPNRQAKLTIESDFGHIVFPNHQPVDIALRIDGQDVGVVAAGTTRAFQVEEGLHRIEATYRLAGRVIDLDSQTVRLSADERRRITINRPEMGLVEVENQLGRTAILYADGERIEMMDAGERRIIALPVGNLRLSFEVRRRVMAASMVNVGPFVLTRFVPELLVGEIRVYNPLVVAVRVEVEDDGAAWIRSGESHVFEDIPVGSAQIRVESRDGTVLNVQSVDIRAGARRSVRIPQPSTGLVWVDSQLSTRLDVFVDASKVGSVEASGRLRLNLSPGMHRIQVRDHAGRTIWTRQVEVELYSTMTLPITSSYVANNEGSGGHIRPN